VIGIRFAVEQHRARDRLDGRDDLVNHLRVAAFAEVRDALDDLSQGSLLAGCNPNPFARALQFAAPTSAFYGTQIEINNRA
jgi:hypothetical protein